MESRAIVRHLRSAPRKVRLLADLIRGLDVGAALDQLAISLKAPRIPMKKLLMSAVANAESKKMDKDRLFIKTITVDGGAMLKRWRARAFGRAAPIRHRTSHITIILGERVGIVKEDTTKKGAKHKKE